VFRQGLQALRADAQAEKEVLKHTVNQAGWAAAFERLSLAAARQRVYNRLADLDRLFADLHEHDKSFAQQLQQDHQTAFEELERAICTLLSRQGRTLAEQLWWIDGPRDYINAAPSQVPGFWKLYWHYLWKWDDSYCVDSLDRLLHWGKWGSGAIGIGAGVAAGSLWFAGAGSVTVSEAGSALASRISTSAIKFRRFLYDPRSWSTISREYWAARGGAMGRSLHHWLFPRRWTWIPEGFRNAGFNRLVLPGLRGVFYRNLTLNTWMGFATKWRGWPRIAAWLVENGIRLGIPILASVEFYVGHRIGQWLSTQLWSEE